MKLSTCKRYAMAPLICLAMILLIVTLPILVPIIWLQNKWRASRMAAVALEFRCAACGEKLGAEGVRLGEERWQAHLADLHVSYPGVKFRIVRNIDAVCPSCGRAHKYLDADRSFVDSDEVLTA